ncbi:cysteine hydrolase [Acidaminobacter sp. JC074]|uniref:cysteine hydrolase family protein n=1 Tax=Acidaminobacter sp. JC074 TaxID=2530199 RepID=UPI001F104DAB|nr:cysteine hydrolase [Acidaminobacter sp. JC074]
MNIALLIIDMQEEFFKQERLKDMMLGASEYINEAASFFRKAGCPVVIVQDAEATNGFDTIKEIEIAPTDIRLTKEFSNSFWKTDLENILKSRGIEFVVVSGFAAEYCVLFTLNGAEERGFGASLLQHGVAGLSKKAVEKTHLLRPTVSLETLYFMLHKHN